MVLERFKFNFSYKATIGLLYKLNILLIVALIIGVIAMFFTTESIAASLGLNTSIPAKSYNIPSSNLGKALATYSAQAGVILVFDPALTDGKVSNGLRGNFGLAEGFADLLKGSGLEVKADDTGEYSLKRAPKDESEGKNLPVDISLKETVVRSQRFYEVGPLPGLGLTMEEIPGNVQSISAKDIKETHSLSIADLMNRNLQSVNVNDYQGNPFQMDVTYRGFTAGPQIGTPQGLSVFLDGIRVNEPFGDVVNWDMIPLNALAGIDVFPGSNPIFGLNTLGGAFSMKTKDGFNNAGVDADVLTGSFGRRQLQASGGWNNGTIGLFGAGNFFLEDGWRQNSPSKVNQVFGKGSYRGEKLDLNLSSLVVWNDLVGNGLYPSDMYKQDRNGIYTAPDTTDNRLWQAQLSGSYFISDNFTVTGQVYRRNSRRHQVGADVFTGYDEELAARRKPNPGEEYTCAFTTTTNATATIAANKYGIPDYYVVPVVADPNSGADIFSSQFVQDYFNNGLVTPAYDNLKNTDLPDALVAGLKANFNFNKNFYEAKLYNNGNGGINTDGPINNYSFGADNVYRTGGTTFSAANFGGLFGATDNIYLVSSDDTYFYTESGGVITKNYVILTTPKNADVCAATRALDAGIGPRIGGNAYTYADSTGSIVTVNGSDKQPGVVEGTPTAVFNDNQIDQIVNGASVQLNWNLEKHKFMVGASIDAATADYSNTSQLGFLDANRNAFLAPELANPQFAGAYFPLSNNNFSGNNTTKSIYFSETWTPVETWHFSASARYNQTKTKNKIAARYGIDQYEIGDLVAIPDNYNVCPNGDCTNVPLNYRLPSILTALKPSETEKFSYYSLNPSLGTSWQATKNLNLYVNWAQGTRTPSVIELGCALDHSPSGVFASDGKGGLYEIPKSIVENRSCTLPTTLSGDPYLPQIKANTYDLGMRGSIGDNVKWNLGAYQTDLKDDIYFVAIGDSRGFFDSIGDTRRRGIEAGLKGKMDKVRFSLNYSLTEATFQNDFLMFSNDNSSATVISGLGAGVINVKPGDRMPGVPLNNLNASVSYDVTDKWTVGLSTVMHSESYVRGNENNEHQANVPQYRNIAGEIVARQPTNNPGVLPGYATVNFQTSYRLSTEWTATLLVNNLLDKEYFSAGRLGRNPFSPSINGAIGPDGYNHNSGDWLSTNFVAPAAPRGIWFSLNYQFDVRK